MKTETNVQDKITDFDYLIYLVQKARRHPDFVSVRIDHNVVTCEHSEKITTYWRLATINQIK